MLCNKYLLSLLSLAVTILSAIFYPNPNPNAALSIGFLQASHTVREDRGMVTLEVGITEGMQETDLTVVVRITLTSGTAQGERLFLAEFSL